MVDHPVSWFQRVRRQSETIVEGLDAEDMLAQSMPDASPLKWHLAHTTWFFETFILSRFIADYQHFNSHFQYLFNSYYQSVGEQYPRPQRGVLTRPRLAEVLAYRSCIDNAMVTLLEQRADEVESLLVVGLHHEMQHQELMLTDVLHLFSCNPLYPAVFEAVERSEAALTPLSFESFGASLMTVGAENAHFSYDNERPQHAFYVNDFRIANRLVCNAEWQQFIEDGGYANPLLWLSEGWNAKLKGAWQAPLYWHRKDDRWWQFGLDGLRPLRDAAPVCHVSYYEADAFARWSGKRLPLEQELEFCLQSAPVEGVFLEKAYWRPQASVGGGAVNQLYGDVWEWTQSSYSPYPGFKAEQGALGEYNGKFMINQQVLKGGSCVTPQAQIRSSYRNFFHPYQRWQYSGLRLADDG